MKTTNNNSSTVKKRGSLAMSIIIEVGILVMVILIISMSILYISMRKTLFFGFQHDLDTASKAMSIAISTSEMESKTNLVAMDILKESTGLEYTIFKGDTRILTTVTVNGERFVGTKMSDKVKKIVIGKNEVYTGTAEINKLTHITKYVPMDGYTLFVGKDIDKVLKQENFALTMSIIASILVFGVGSFILALIFKKRITTPLKALTKISVKLQNGDVGIKDTDLTLINELKNHEAINNEIGTLVGANISTFNSLHQQIAETCSALDEIAKGNLDFDVSENYIGDFLYIETAIKTTLNNLNLTLSAIQESSQQVTSGAEQVATGSQALSQGATEQASSIQELSATIADIATQVKQNAINANTANEKADSVSMEIKNGGEQMKGLSSAMIEINSSSKEISKIIKTISDIAFQTNILALNAAVEAARAGVAGKGFAVVAEEVRNLASKSDAAAKNTTALIEGSISAVNKGTNMAKATETAFKEITEGAKVITDLISEISNASNDQAASIKEIDVGVEQISSVVQTNSATAEESAAASEELSGQAVEMQEYINKFNLKNY
ncbi:MAG: methyl-accepting chemotaxis protein [Oscillospiraceae bacterium]